MSDELEQAAETPPPAQSGEIRLTPGALLGDTYEIEQLLAAGGMAEVFRARNIHTGEPVAVKAILTAFARDTTMLAMFKKEATVLSRLQHDAIVRYYHFTIDRQNGVPYLVMEFVDGTPLNTRLARAPLDWATAQKLVLRVASALGAAHKAGVVHRDLSPDNIILPEDDVDRAKIIDFGIAKAGAIGGATVVGQNWAGKYNYMSPEQLGLFGGEVTNRSDIYSLGLIAAAAVLGEPLDMAGSLTEIIEKRRTVPDLSGVDSHLRPAIAKMLEPKPEDRPADIDAVIAMLSAPEPKLNNDRTVLIRPAPAKQSPAAADPSQTIAPRPAPAAIPAGDDSPFGPPVAATPPPFRPEPIARAELGTAAPRQRNGLLVGTLVALGVIVIGGGIAYQQGLLTRPAPIADMPVVKTAPEPVITPPAEVPVVTEQAITAEPEMPIEAPVAVATETPPSVPPVEPEPQIAEPASTEPEPQIAELPAPEPTPTVATPPPITTPVSPPTPQIVATAPPADVTINTALDDVGWLKAYPLSACQFATVTSVADNAVTINALSTDVAPLQTLMEQFQSARGYEPDISLGLTAQAQCPAVDFLRTTDPITASGPLLTLSRYNIPSGAPFQGFIEGVAGRQLQLLMVDAEGAVSPVPVVLSTSGNAASFDLTLTSDSPQATPMLLVLLASKNGLAGGKLTSPVPAQTLFPELLTEIQATTEPVAVTPAFFKID